MSSITPITSQLNSVGNCNSNNCCEQIAALTSRIAALESKTSQVKSTADAAKGQSDEAIKKTLAATAAIGVLGAQVGGFGIELAQIAAIAAAAKATAAKALGDAAAAAGQAASAIGKAGQAASSAAGALAKVGTLALQVAGIAYAIYLAQQAVDTAGKALGNSVAAVVRAVRAGENADAAIGIAVKATDIANGATLDANRAEVAAVGALNAIKALAATVAGLPGQIGSINTIATGAAAVANQALDAVTGATNIANRALTAAAGAVGAGGRAGAPGRDGIPGQTGATGQTGAPGRDGANGRDGAASDPTIPSRVQRLESKVGDNTVNPGKEAEILADIAKLSTAVLAMPTSIANSQTFRAAATSAAAAGACQSARPGGCNGGSADQISKLEGLMGGLSTAYGALNNALLNTMNGTLNLVNSKLGAQITGGLSKWTTNIAEVANRSQILNILTWIGVLHNAYFASNALAQTLFSAVGNSLAALGIKDTSQDPAGTPFNVSKILGDWTEKYFVSIFGTATVNGIKADWKKYSRIYQAAAQVMYSVQSIGQSMLGALEVVGSQVARVGNAMKKFRLVGEKAYNWMNPQPNFQNRFFTVLQQTQEVVSQIDQVASSVLSTKETIDQLKKNKEDLDNSLKQNEFGKDGSGVPIAGKTLEENTLEILNSASSISPDSILTKP